MYQDGMWGDRLKTTIETGLKLIKQFRGDLKLGDKIWTDEEIDIYLNLNMADIAEVAQEIVGDCSEHHC